MKIVWQIGLLSFLLIGSAAAQKQEDTAEFLSSFLEGRYEVIGRWPESDSLYAGSVAIRNIEGRLQMIRNINGHTTTCTARIEPAAMAETQVLRARFSVNGMYYEATYLIHSDLDNYARLSGYVYQKGKQTKRPGLEALFIKLD
ncbi:MAG TPA: hypothetical protein ENK44_07530 [Caldithrix abyssi]|uniref:Uncharacterized protein n=1 Tax=Caldithrix abyssi TaxID=187145 RepID=A0A7V4WV46_CALAY|nr:hypothetical protein [Caldithrix abyssi]